MTQNIVLSSFIDFGDAPETPLLDRSTIEQYANCPAAARMIEQGKVNNHSRLSATGQAVHDAFKQTIDEYVDSRGAMQFSDLRDALFNWVSAARPDIQPDAVAAIQGAVYPWCKMIASTNVNNILRYDGGEGDRKGQIAHDICGVRLTCELDLLIASPSPEVIYLYDYKTGHKHWTEETVRSSFQFAFYSYLTLKTYPEVDAVRVKIWNTRLRQLTYGVFYNRSDVTALEGRIVGAIGAWRDYHNSDKAPAWPTVDKCCICPAAALCPVAGLDISECAANPGAFLDATNAVQETLKARTKLLAAHVKKTGEEIVGSGSLRFGVGKVSARKPSAKIYIDDRFLSDSEDGEEQ